MTSRDVARGLVGYLAHVFARLQLKNSNRSTPNTDLTTNYLSYWTDNGAYYYGDQWQQAGGGGAPCNESSMLAVAAGLQQQQLLDSVRIWQLVSILDFSVKCGLFCVALKIGPCVHVL